MSRPPLGHKLHAVLRVEGAEAARALACEHGHPDLFDRVTAFASEDPSPSFLHSALCAMSLPIRRPADEHAPIIRQDGQYTLAITPKPVLLAADAPQRLASLGVPFGTLPRLILIHIMSKAVRSRSRTVHLGDTLTEWMRHMGYRTVSYGPRGSATLIRQQLDRLLACEWMIRWDGRRDDGAREFGIKEIKLSNDYAGFDTGSSFAREIRLTEGFYEHLLDHAVPLDENAIRQLRDSATALDLYTWLAYRLPRLSDRKPATLNWRQLAAHFGNDGTHIRKFRQTVRDAWERQVSAVYPEARADFDGSLIRLHASPAPLARLAVKGARLGLVEAGLPEPATDADGTPACFLRELRERVGATEAKLWFGDARLERDGEVWLLRMSSDFKASWARSHFAAALEHAAGRCGLQDVPQAVGPARAVAGEARGE